MSNPRVRERVSAPHSRSRRAAGPVTFLTLVAIGASAAAFWSANGAGEGYGRSGDVVAVSLSPGTASADLRPGGLADVVLSVSNPNPSTVYVDRLAIDTAEGVGGYEVDAAHSGCSLASLTFTAQTNGGAGWTVPARVGAVDGTLAVDLANSIAMSDDAADACQGVRVTLYLTAGP